MYASIAPGAVGVRTESLEDALAVAQRGRFRGLEVSAHDIAERVDRVGAPAVRALFDDAGIVPAGCGLPIDWRDAGRWEAGLQELPRLAAALAAIGCTRTFTWIAPADDNLAFDENWRLHVDRFTPIAAAFAGHGIRVGLEFIGPATLRAGLRHEFVHTMRGMLDLAAAIGPNVGLLLDCWHWYTSHGTVSEIRSLRNANVVHVHLNDAPAAVAVDEQIDSVRKLPGSTGVIDIAGFLDGLDAIGYDGPVTPEPFGLDLDSLPSDEARLAATTAAMERVMGRYGAMAAA